MAPETIDILKNIGQALGLIVTGLTGVYGGRKLEKKRTVGNSRKYVPQGECKLRHLAEKERWNHLLNNYNEIKQDVREINKQITLINVHRKPGD